MRSLVPGAEPRSIDTAGIYHGNLELGYLDFDEFTRGTWDRRLIRVKVYPDILSAQTIYAYEKGLRDQTLKPHDTLSHLRYGVYDDQIEQLRKGQDPFMGSFIYRKPSERREPGTYEGYFNSSRTIS